MLDAYRRLTKRGQNTSGSIWVKHSGSSIPHPFSAPQIGFPDKVSPIGWDLPALSSSTPIW